jgi:hypothetical protein
MVVDPAVVAAGFAEAFLAVFRFAFFLAAFLAGFFSDFLFAFLPAALLFFFFFAAFLPFLFLAIVASVEGCRTSEPGNRARAIQPPGRSPGELNSLAAMLESRSW